jgi:signal peptidase II
MGRDRQSGRVAVRVADYLYGPYTRLGVGFAVVACAIDQVTKIWLLQVYGLAQKGIVALAPMLDLVLTWNTGISYGLFPQESALGRWLLLGAKLVAVMALWAWLARARSALTAVSLGLIIGGAFGNAIDRLAYGAVADFVLFHVTTASFNFTWYVFNLADAAIVAGVIGLLYESFLGGAPQKRPDPA